MSLERLTARGVAAARARAERRRAAIAAALEQAVPREIEVDVDGEGVRLSGRRLARRLLLDPALRWLVTEAGR